jgi:FkbM family methyltransferase
MFVSYAQNLEDVILARCFPGKTDGFYVDVGASHPVIDSVTHAFYERGWRGINIEPLPDRIAELAYARPRDINLRLALADQPGQATFHVFPRFHGLSTLDGTIAADMARWGDEAYPVDVEISTLAAVLAAHDVGAIDFLKIDVEGAEARVLAGADFSRWRPVVVLVEATYPTTSVASHHDWEPDLIAAGYRFVLFDGLNRFYLREESSDLAACFQLPPNVFDDFVRHDSHGDPLANADHPDHAFARHLAATWFNALGRVDEAALTALFADGLALRLRTAPITAESFEQIWRIVFGGLAPTDAVGPYLSREPRPTGDDVLAELIRSPLFKAARSRLARW